VVGSPLFLTVTVGSLQAKIGSTRTALVRNPSADG